eukprot:356761-Chlamydomonas_euryale.AAC.4
MPAICVRTLLRLRPKRVLDVRIGAEALYIVQIPYMLFPSPRAAGLRFSAIQHRLLAADPSASALPFLHTPFAVCGLLFVTMAIENTVSFCLCVALLSSGTAGRARVLSGCFRRLVGWIRLHCKLKLCPYCSCQPFSAKVPTDPGT